jgi:ATP-dependent Lhr-like helicase
VWKGVITNDTFHALRAFTRPPQRQRRRAGTMPVRSFRSRRQAPPSAEGRWSLVSSRATAAVSPTEWSTATAQQLLARYGVVTRDVAAAEGISGGFSAVYDVLKALEMPDASAAAISSPASAPRSSRCRRRWTCSARCASFPRRPRSYALAATDPGQPLRHDPAWPGAAGENDAARRTTRSVGSLVILVNGALGAYISRGARQLQVFLPEGRTGALDGRAAASPAGWRRWRERAACSSRKSGGIPTAEHPIAPFPHRCQASLRRHGLHGAENFAWKLPTSNLPTPKKRNCGSRMGA